MPVPCLPNKHSNELVLTPDYRVYTYIWANLKTNKNFILYPGVPVLLVSLIY